MLIGHLAADSSDIWIEMQHFSYKRMNFKFVLKVKYRQNRALSE